MNDRAMAIARAWTDDRLVLGTSRQQRLAPFGRGTDAADGASEQLDAASLAARIGVPAAPPETHAAGPQPRPTLSEGSAAWRKALRTS